MSDKCPKCGAAMNWLGGAPAHPDNQYCTDENGCGYRAWGRESSSALPACSNAGISKDQAADLAIAIAEKWWDERKLSYGWNPNTDVAWLAQAIYEGKMPEPSSI